MKTASSALVAVGFVTPFASATFGYGGNAGFGFGGGGVGGVGGVGAGIPNLPGIPGLSGGYGKAEAPAGGYGGQEASPVYKPEWVRMQCRNAVIRQTC